MFPTRWAVSGGTAYIWALVNAVAPNMHPILSVRNRVAIEIEYFASDP